MIVIKRILCTVFLMAYGVMAIAEDNPLLNQQTARPFQAESTNTALEPWLTPISGFFIRSHHTTPYVDPKTYVLIIDGLVDKPLKLTLNDLQKMRQVSLYAILECSGNGRGLQRPQAPGLQWLRGAVGNALWTGVPLADILKLAGVKKNGKFLRLEGADKPALPATPAFIRSIPIEKALHHSSLIALKMNEEPLPLLQGAPARVVLPNWYAETWMKWITHITVSEAEDTGFYMQKAYRIPKQQLKPGDSWDPAKDGVPIETIKVQSLIVSPKEGEVVAPGKMTVRGKAFTGRGLITAVDLSVDGGKTWQAAELDKTHPIVSGSWIIFTADLQLPATTGPLTILSRATDSAGNVQPMEQPWNPSGYLRNAIDRVTVSIGDPSLVAGRDLLQQKCLTCHSLDFIGVQRLTKPQWEKELAKMQYFGAVLSPAETALMLSYLETFSPSRQSEPLSPADYDGGYAKYLVSSEVLRADSKKGGELYAANCASCHGVSGIGASGPRLANRAMQTTYFQRMVFNGAPSMPAFEDKLNREDVLNIQAFLLRSDKK